MTKHTALYGCLVATFLLTGCDKTPADTREADAKALRANEAQWNQDLVSKDVDKLVAHYSDNAILMSPGMASSSGKDAIRRTLKDLVADPAATLKFQATRVEVAKSGDLAYTQGTYSMTMTDPGSKKVINDHGSYVTTYTKQADGAWKAVADIASSEVPPAPPVTKAKAPKAKAKTKAKGKARR